MKTVSKSRLKARMLEIFRDLEHSGGELIVTDHGKPVLKVMPVGPVGKTVDDVFGSFRSGALLPEDLVLASTEEEWPQLKEEREI
jgi:antitoxin (DNA-binding transcriptional repressor) of toxin-antitoxin stability system